MGSRATLPATVNVRIPAERRSGPIEEGRGPAALPQGLQPEFGRAGSQEKGITIKDMDLDLPFQAGDPSESPSANEKEKERQGLGRTSRGKSVLKGECSEPAASPAGLDELPDDHPMQQEEGSLLHSSFLVLLALGSMSILRLVYYLEFHTSTYKFPENWWDELEDQLMGNRHFLKRDRLFTTCGDENQPPSKRKRMEASVVSGDQDKNLVEYSHAGMSTAREVQKRTPALPLAMRTPVPSSAHAVPTAHQPKSSDEDVDWTSSVEDQEPASERTKNSFHEI